MWNSTVTRVQLSDCISLLHDINRVPAEPRESLQAGPVRNSFHYLERDRENKIVSNLAFLSATTDNYLKVMAVCVEEDPGGYGVTIRLASNTGDLAAVIRGFRGLAKNLEQAASRGWYISNPNSKILF